ncbi:hypothetical protein DAPPUDRAFT_332766, partial [Daphnia pulex]
FPVDNVRKAASLGCCAIYAREDCVGTGLSRLDAFITFEALSRGCVSTTAHISIHNMCAWMMYTFGREDLRKTWIPQLASIEKLASCCITEPGAGSDAGSLNTAAKKSGNDLLLNSAKVTKN